MDAVIEVPAILFKFFKCFSCGSLCIYKVVNHVSSMVSFSHIVEEFGVVISLLHRLDVRPLFPEQFVLNSFTGVFTL